MNWGVHLAMITVQFLFASLTVAAKFVLPSVSPMGIVFFRITGAALAFGAWHLLAGRERVRDRRDLVEMAALALVGVVLNQVFFLEGVARTTAINTNILVTTVPAFTLTFALILGRERASVAKVAGIVVAAGGAVWLIGPDRISLDPAMTLGNAFIVTNASLHAAYLVLSKRLLERYQALTVLTYLFLLGAVYVTPVGILVLRDVDITALPGRAALALFYVVAFSSILAYYLVIWSLGRTASSLVAMYIYLQPLMTALGAPFILGERITPRAGLAALLIFGGLAAATWGARRNGSARRAPSRAGAAGAPAA